MSSMTAASTRPVALRARLGGDVSEDHEDSNGHRQRHPLDASLRYLNSDRHSIFPAILPTHRKTATWLALSGCFNWWAVKDSNLGPID
ncbi:hypothetical protein XAP6164_5820004 [Xanthomonas phaseoli pv. phaseoli]|nr:hypothetical protein XAP6164_5820004 [Xanthomonas phaseoli pv. phaseoli]